jgi:hypothetical protein
VPAIPGMVVQQVTATFTGGPTLSAGTVYTLVLRAGSTYQAGWTGSGSGADAWTGNGSSWSLISPTSVPAHLAFTLSVGVASSYSISFVSPTTTQWTAGKTVPVAIQLKDGSGAPMRDADAAALAAAHNVTVEASGAQTLTAQSMKYNRRTDQFTYSLRLARTTSGAVQITVTGTGHTGAGSSALDITVVPR